MTQVSVKLDSTGTTAVDPNYHWIAMKFCPVGVKVRVIGSSGVSTTTIWDGREKWLGWVPEPTFAKDAGEAYATRST